MNWLQRDDILYDDKLDLLRQLGVASVDCAELQKCLSAARVLVLREVCGKCIALITNLHQSGLYQLHHTCCSASHLAAAALHKAPLPSPSFFLSGRVAAIEQRQRFLSAHLSTKRSRRAGTAYPARARAMPWRCRACFCTACCRSQLCLCRHRRRLMSG
jgi:hypothetical protein